MSSKSRYTLIIDSLSSVTRSRDIKYESERFGKVLCVERDARARCALVEFQSSRDAQRAWEKLDGLRLDGCRWKVDWAVRKDFDFFGWKWTEGPSRSPSRSPSRPVEMTY
ncbi:hypothetical protein CHLNCDRAFT_137149 [Chlorella variabilis]|uniref:RRM domain-containing protein n=1 Tax=Chlorella variabilis TaxID=554065 RepID=E1ZLC5_CHLVA|nr:hypothetical protein CHLNCDRAFT_137149 [Chlorella variabilis]EFN53242.1 hypothetical protein CHLNCDRAFT_137149 [Chlorella variabilis]|eukprot:XP_005845344.1 hypothetical protein CHLNCDRAFT_137149 [Chlorella variabilis]